MAPRLPLKRSQLFCPSARFLFFFRLSVNPPPRQSDGGFRGRPSKERQRKRMMEFVIPLRCFSSSGSSSANRYLCVWVSFLVVPHWIRFQFSYLVLESRSCICLPYTQTHSSPAMVKPAPLTSISLADTTGT